MLSVSASKEGRSAEGRKWLRGSQKERGGDVLCDEWFRIGLNFGNMPVSLWTLIFHGSLAALFALYFVFWLQLNMFETVKYLAVVGGLTYLAGNRVLRAIADKRK
ncbi:hypothetical protein COOONC_26323 [Cooperia oncophora]